jgi:hypothetical protein
MVTLLWAVGLERITPNKQTNNKLRGLSPRAHYTDRAAAAGRRR